MVGYSSDIIAVNRSIKLLHNEHAIIFSIETSMNIYHYGESLPVSFFPFLPSFIPSFSDYQV